MLIVFHSLGVDTQTSTHSHACMHAHMHARTHTHTYIRTEVILRNQARAWFKNSVAKTSAAQ